MANRWGKNGNSDRLFFWSSKITVDSDCSHVIKRHLLLGRKAMTNLDSILKSRDITLLTKVQIVKAMAFPVVMYACESWIRKKAEKQTKKKKEGWALKNCSFRTIVAEKTLESPLDSKEIQPINPKGNQPWIFIRRTDAEAKALILSSPDVKSWLFGKDPDAEKGWGQEEKGVTEDETVGRHHWYSGHESEQAAGDGEGQAAITWYRHCHEHPKWGDCSIDRLRNLSPNKWLISD